jgi:hypothetical protein
MVSLSQPDIPSNLLWVTPIPPSQDRQSWPKHLDAKGEVNRKAILVALGTWAVITGRRWLVRAVQHTLTREGLRHA